MGHSRLMAVAALAAALAVCSPATAQKKYGPGASDSEIKIGNTMPYSGPASAYGTIGRAEAAYFKMINEQGGINGRKLNFITLDDGYSPPRTVEQVRKLVEQEEVLLIFQPLGTPSNSAIQQYLNTRKVPISCRPSPTPRSPSSIRTTITARTTSRASRTVSARRPRR